MGQGPALKNLDHYIERTIKNIESDRKVTRELLDDVMRLLSKDEQLHKEVGAIAAKYVETLQRSNEQLVKVSTLIHKKQANNDGLTEEDKKEIFNLIQEEN